MKLADAVGRNSLVLGLVALLITLALAGTQLLTREQIAAQRRAAEARAYNEILPPARYDNVLLDDFRLVDDRELLGLQQARNVGQGQVHQAGVEHGQRQAQDDDPHRLAALGLRQAVADGRDGRGWRARAHGRPASEGRSAMRREAGINIGPIVARLAQACRTRTTRP